MPSTADPARMDASLMPGGVRTEFKSHPVGRSEELVSPDVDGAFLGTIMCAVFRLARWRCHELYLDRSSHYTKLDQTYPYSVIFAHTILGCPSYFLGD